MSELAREREALSRTCLKAMRAKGLTFKSLAEEIDVSPFITAAALLGQMALPKEVAARAAKALGFKEAEAFLTEIPYRGSLGIAGRYCPRWKRASPSLSGEKMKPSCLFGKLPLHLGCYQRISGGLVIALGDLAVLIRREGHRVRFTLPNKLVRRNVDACVSPSHDLSRSRR